MAKGAPWSIYLLIDPLTKDVRYVGCAEHPKRRLRDHVASCRSAKERHSHKARWIALLRGQGLRPQILVVETGFGDTWAEAERRWIATGRALGIPLTNGSDGGDGVPGPKGPVWRERLMEAIRRRSASEAWRARHADPAFRIQMSIWAKLRIVPPRKPRKTNGVGKGSESARLARDPAWLRMITEAARARSSASSWRQNNAEQGRRNAADPAWRAALKAGCANEDRRARIAEAKRAYWKRMREENPAALVERIAAMNAARLEKKRR